MPDRLKDSSGFALAMAVFALVLLAAIVAGGYFSASQEFQIGRGMRSTTTSFYAGEAGIRDILANWDPTVYGAMVPGDSLTVGPVSFAGGGSYTATVTRVGSTADSLKRYYYIEAAGRPPSPAVGERRQAVVARVMFPDICCTGAVRVLNQVFPPSGNDVFIDGLNNDPPGTWPASACSGIPGDSMPAVVVWRALNVTANVADTMRLNGAPRILVDPSQVTQASLFDTGTLTYNELVALADHEFAGGMNFNNTQPTVVNGECDRSNPLNWGAPTNSSHVCFDYFPIIHINGDLNLVGSGSAQGILLVDGNLNMNGPFQFFGIALVKRDLNMSGSVDFYGGAMVGDDVDFNGAKPVFWYSRCAVERAERLSNLAKPRLVSPRAWVELF
jgi:hypothetical protein